MRISLLLMLLVWQLSTSAQEQHLIPQPTSVVPTSQGMVLTRITKIELVNGDSTTERVVRSWIDQMNKVTGFYWFLSKDAITPATLPNSIRFTRLAKKDDKIGDEGYYLNVSGGKLDIKANTAAGIFYAIQTLQQLLPKEVLSTTPVRNKAWTLPGVAIEDQPRFAWRGLLFDVVRHFFTKEEVMRFIDEMVQYKYNVLHLHLSDDQGWRLEIRSLPRLTEVGAWRVDKTGRLGTFSAPEPNEPRNYGGYYTQEDMKEIIAYARDRFVHILPEIDVPGHSMAAVAAYPELSCTPGNYVVNSGEKFMQWGSGTFSALVDNTLCPANEQVYEFLDKVYTEVAELFPFEYIHMGGDECAKNFWQKSAAVTALMKKEGLKDYDEVQSYFVKRVANIIQSKGKKMMGWDEIMDGGLAPGAAVMSWRGEKGGIEAAKMGHEVVMTPNTHVYVDLMQGDSAIEPPNYSMVRLKKTFEFDPLPKGVDPRWIKGGQANLWTEQIYNFRQVQYMLWPRAFAVANSVWSKAPEKDWSRFVENMEKHFERFDYAGIKYATSLYEPEVKVTRNDKKQLVVELIKEATGVTFYYSFDNSYPDAWYPAYESPLVVPKDAQRLRVVSYKNGKQVGRFMTLTVEELNKRVKK